MKGLSEKIKTDKKVRNTVICSVVGAVVVIALAVAVPVSVHSSNVKKALADEQAAQTTEAYEANSEENTEAVTEPVTEETTAEVTEATTAVPTTQASNSSSASNTGKGSSSGGNSGSGNSGAGASSKESSGNSSGSQGQNNPPAPAQSNEKNPELAWTQADVDAAVAEAKQYAKSRGLVIDSSLTEKGTSWSSPIDTRWDYKSNAAVDLHYQIDRFYNLEIEDFGCVNEKSKCNIFSINCGSYWEIYVVY